MRNVRIQGQPKSVSRFLLSTTPSSYPSLRAAVAVRLAATFTAPPLYYLYLLTYFVKTFSCRADPLNPLATLFPNDTPAQRRQHNQRVCRHSQHRCSPFTSHTISPSHDTLLLIPPLAPHDKHTPPHLSSLTRTPHSTASSNEQRYCSYSDARPSTTPACVPLLLQRPHRGIKTTQRSRHRCFRPLSHSTPYGIPVDTTPSTTFFSHIASSPNWTTVSSQPLHLPNAQHRPSLARLWPYPPLTSTRVPSPRPSHRSFPPSRSSRLFEW